MEAEFSRQRLMDNISSLMRDKSLKVGAVESAIGLSTGYLSKIIKKETDASPSVETIWKLAKVLGVSTDMLIEGDFTEVTDNLQYAVKFIAKLKSETDANELSWETITIDAINHSLCDVGRQNYPIIGDWQLDDAYVVPLAQVKKKEGISETIGCDTLYIRSIGLEASATWVNGNGFKTEINGGVGVYLFHMGSAFSSGGEYSETDYFDMYFENVSAEGHRFEPVCNTYTRPELSEAVSVLYRSIQRRETDLKLSMGVKSIMSAFMREKSRPDKL